MSCISLSASGLTLSYHQGVVKTLMKNKVITNKSKFYGTSGGAVTSILTKCNICPDKQHKLTKEILNIVHKKEEKNIATVLYKYLNENLPENCAELCNNYVNCSMFKLALPFPHSYVLESFQNKADVIDATISSCYIPFVIGDTLTWKFRGQRHVDGGLEKDNVLINIENGIHVASMPKSQVENYKFDTFADIYMGLNGSLPFEESVINDSSYSINENPDFFCDSLFELGEIDANYFINNNYNDRF
jgi:hypothetical protein